MTNVFIALGSSDTFTVVTPIAGFAGAHRPHPGRHTDFGQPISPESYCPAMIGSAVPVRRTAHGNRAETRSWAECHDHQAGPHGGRVRLNSALTEDSVKLLRYTGNVNAQSHSVLSNGANSSTPSIIADVQSYQRWSAQKHQSSLAVWLADFTSACVACGNGTNSLRARLYQGCEPSQRRPP